VAKPGQTLPATLAAVALILGTLVLIRLGKAGPTTLVALVGIGVILRLIRFRAVEADPLTVTVAAINQALSGMSPYSIGPAGSLLGSSTFPYGPVSLAWYFPVQFEPRLMELAAATAVLVALAVWRRPLGLAIYASAPIFVLLATDGSNDTSAGLLILLALVVAERHARAGGAFLAVAAAFKPYAAAWLLPLVAWAGLLPLVAFLAASAVLWLPLLAWGPGSFVGALHRAEDVHAASYYSLAAGLEQVLGRPMDKAMFGPLRLVLGLGTAIFVWVAIRSHDAVVVGGSLVFLVTMYAGYWGTPAYLAAIAPILCWKVDGWVTRAPVRESVSIEHPLHPMAGTELPEAL
jgi:hypothetical protein